jgi:hypothetical protein
MVAEVMVTVGKAAARAAVVAALYNVLSADAPVGAPPEGNAKEVTRRRRRVTTTVSRNDSVKERRYHGDRQLARRVIAACRHQRRLCALDAALCHCAP